MKKYVVFLFFNTSSEKLNPNLHLPSFPLLILSLLFFGLELFLLFVSIFP